MKCSKCGADIKKGQLFCPECGIKVKGNGTKIIIILVVVLILMLLIVAGLLAVLFGDDSGSSSGTVANNVQSTIAPTKKPTEKPIEAPTINPVVSTETNSSSVVHERNPQYATYRNSKFDFSCKYPLNFHVVSSGENVYEMENADGSARLSISVGYNYGETVSESKYYFDTGHNGAIEYSSSGDTFYAERINYNGTCYYRYYKSVGAVSYYFDLIYPSNYQDIYDKYVNDIYQSITYN